LFGFGGTPKTHGQLAKEEFSVGFDHMLQAATHAAGGVGSAVGPRVYGVRSRVTPAAGRVRSAASSGWDSTVGTLVPLMTAAREGAREATEVALKAKAKQVKRRQKEEQVKQRRIGLALGMLTAGAAVGAVTALVVRRRRRNTWEDYDPSDALESMMDSAGDRAADVEDTASDLRDKASDMSQKAGDAVQKGAEKTGDAMQKTTDTTMARGRDVVEDAGANAGDMNSKVRRG